MAHLNRMDLNLSVHVPCLIHKVHVLDHAAALHITQDCVSAGQGRGGKVSAYLVACKARQQQDRLAVTALPQGASRMVF